MNTSSNNTPQVSELIAKVRKLTPANREIILDLVERLTTQNSDEYKREKGNIE